MRPLFVEETSPDSAAASELVRALEPEIFEARAPRVVKRRAISQSPKARRVSIETPALTAAASVAQTPVPAGPPAMTGEAADATAADVTTSSAATARPARMVRVRVFMVFSCLGLVRLFAAVGVPESEPSMPLRSWFIDWISPVTGSLAMAGGE